MTTEPSDKTAIDYVQEWIQQKTQKWLKLLVHKVLSTGSELVEEDVDEALKVFLCEEGLIDDASNECEQILLENYEIAKSQNYETPQIELVSLEDIRGVNLLAEGQKLTFNPNLTVIYGKNASGKSGYVRILKKACGTRTVEDIWDNVYSNPQKNICQANIKIRENGVEKPIYWKGEQKINPLSNIRVFDSKCVKVHLTDKLAFTVFPFGFEVFSMIANSITAIRQKLQEIVFTKKQVKDFSHIFNADTEVFRLISNLSYSTKEEDFIKLSCWSDEKDRSLQTKIQEINDLKAVNLETTIKLIKNEKLQFEKAKTRTETISSNFSEASLTKQQELISKFKQKKETLTKKQIADLSKYIIENRGSEEWNNFIESAEKYIQTLSKHEHYPSESDKCIYCQQNLTKEALELIKTYREISESPELKELKDVEIKIESEIAVIENLDFSLMDLPEDSEINVIKLKNYFDQAEDSRKRLLQNLKSRDWLDITFYTHQEILNKLAGIITLIEKKISDLTSEDKVKKEKIEKVQKEVNELKDQKTLSGKKDEILEYLKTLKWLYAVEQSLNKLNPKPVTDLSKRAWEGLVSEKFISKFEEERKNFNAPLIDFNFPAEYGAQMRAKSLAGLTNINDILSEGEQKAIALADFLAEASIKGEKQPLVFDDPVTSFDHRNREKIAERLVEESHHRQVIIFTHDIMFVNDIYECSRDKSSDTKYHIVETIGDQTGIVSLDEIPMVENLNRRMQEVKEAIKNAENSAGRYREKYIEDGYGNLRACCENIITEKVLAKVIQRFDPEIKMSRLKDMVIDNDLVKDINELFEDCSRYIVSHSHANPLRQNTPDIDNLKNDLKRLENILGKINKYRRGSSD